jgi:ornithine cyclodeaminase/alanine dehydrogenase-like protein (mu-crystallin family)
MLRHVGPDVDSTGLAIQDLAICRAVDRRWRDSAIDAPVVSL